MIENDSVLDDFTLHLKSLEITKIGNIAVRKVQEESRQKGIPLVYSVDGKIYYELADGTVTTTSPFVKKQIKITKMLKDEKVEFSIAPTPIKCDYCGYEDIDCTWGNPNDVFEKWEGKMCPKCGKPMLTVEQVQSIKAILSTAEFANIESGTTLEIDSIGNISSKL